MFFSVHGSRARDDINLFNESSNKKQVSRVLQCISLLLFRPVYVGHTSCENSLARKPTRNPCDNHLIGISGRERRLHELRHRAGA